MRHVEESARGCGGGDGGRSLRLPVVIAADPAWTQDGSPVSGVRIPRGAAGAPRAWAMAVAALLRLRRGRLLSWRAGRPNLRHSTFLHAILHED